MKILQPKKEHFHIENSDIFQNIDCGYSSKPPRRAVLTSTTIYGVFFFQQNKKNNVYPCKPKFYYIKLGLKGIKIIQAFLRDDYLFLLSPFNLSDILFVHLHTETYTISPPVCALGVLRDCDIPWICKVKDI